MDTPVTSDAEIASESSAAVSRETLQRPPALMLLALTLGLSVILTLLLVVFIMPSLKSGAHDLPVAIVCSSETADEVESTLAATRPDAFTFSTYASEEELVSAIGDRTVMSGFMCAEGTDSTESTVHTFIASAGSVAISATIGATGEALAAHLDATAEQTDVVPLPAADPSGVGIGGLAFPLVFGGIVPAVAFRTVFSRRLGWAVSGIIGFSAIGGAVVAAVLAFLFGSISSAVFWPVAGAMALGIAALALPLAGLKELFGGKGFTIGAMAMMFLGNPLAGISTSAAWLPDWLGWVGQALPPGSAGTLVRAAAYFDGAGGLGATLVLATWTVAGALMLSIAAARSRRGGAAA